MTPPSWYPAKILEYLASTPKTSSVAYVTANGECDRTTFSLWRYFANLFHEFVELPRKGAAQDFSINSNRVFGCLGSKTICDLPVMNQKRSITLFIKGIVGKFDLEGVLESAVNLKKTIRAMSGGSVFVAAYDNNANHTDSDIHALEISESKSLSLHLLEVLSADREFLKKSLENSTILSQSLPNGSNIFYINSIHVKLPNWILAAVKLNNDSSIFLDTKKDVIVESSAEENCNLPSCFNIAQGINFKVIRNRSSKESSDDNTLMEIYLPIGVGAFVLVIMILLVTALLRRSLIKKRIAKEKVKFYIDNEDLTPINKRSNTTLSVSSATNSRQANGYFGHEGGKSFASLKTADSDLATELGLASGDNYAKLNGDVVFLRYIRTKNLQLRGTVKQLISNMRDLRGDNINGFLAFFVGCHTPSFRPPAVVFEYCSRGSLMDLIDKEEIKLDWSFKVSFLSDIVRGLKSIHNSSVRFHGRLTSRKCVIDTRWTLKITDYAINRLEYLQNNEKTGIFMADEHLYWTSPEMLRNDMLMREGTPKGDIYSFAIIMQELILRGRPFCTSELTASEVIQKVRHPPPLLRPHVPNQTAQPEAIMIMKECWSENPEMRPSVDEIINKFKALNQGRKTNIVDSMFAMLEKYSNNLEELIHERTEELNEEKKKTEQLLYRMMPQTVAEKLKTGQPVEPETFAEVTIYFSDIVGFTTISAYSTPMEIVNLLNDLYSLFDTTLSFYDVYKVETIGDAYMVVSGLPVTNGDKHAGEIATVALELLHQCGRFKIRHLFEVPLFLRIGVHTGSCAAGVVGLTMPRYCLFGDTVNTASRMESTSRAYRIHLSDTAHNLLEKLGGYQMQFRGVTQIKGKGGMNTYWLYGKDGYDKVLPEPAPDTGENHGIDEKLVIRGRELQKLRDAEAEAHDNDSQKADHHVEITRRESATSRVTMKL
ncbi:retinal guanylyl cyclase 1-like isoform X2 [Paramacrobiotus metropolitanus]|nr:retinal guanylyl cyclase 1-like isoform X2 [Paramacrobiotus metropolitanus]